jgi:hypothetical protein
MFSEERFVGVSEAEPSTDIDHSYPQVWCVWEVNFVLFNSMLKYVINRLMHAFIHIRTLGPISVSRDDNSLDMEKGMH